MKIMLAMLALVIVTNSAADSEISGYIYDANYNPVNAQKVVIINHNTSESIESIDMSEYIVNEVTALETTDQAGYFSFTGLVSGTYYIIVLDNEMTKNYGQSYQYRSVIIDLTNQIHSLHIYPTSVQVVTLCGSMLTSQTFNPIYADVAFTPENPEQIPGPITRILNVAKIVSTDKHGLFIKYELIPSVYIVSISNMDKAKYGRSDISVKIRVKDDGTVEYLPYYEQYLNEMGFNLKLWTVTHHSGQDSTISENKNGISNENPAPVQCPKCNGNVHDGKQCELCGGSGMVWVENIEESNKEKGVSPIIYKTD